MRASATKLAGRSDRQFPSSPNDNAQMKDVISSAGMRAEAYGERKTKSMPMLPGVCSVHQKSNGTVKSSQPGGVKLFAYKTV